MLRKIAGNCAYLLLLLGILAACAQIEIPATPTPGLRFSLSPAPLTMTFEGFCHENLLLLEQWYGAASAASVNLARIIDAVASNAPNYLIELQSLSIMRAGIADLPAPDCTRSAHVLLASTVDAALLWTQSRANGDPNFQGPGEQELRRHLALFDTMLEELEGLLYKEPPEF